MLLKKQDTCFKLTRRESKVKGQANHLQEYNVRFIFWLATQLSKVRLVTLHWKIWIVESYYFELLKHDAETGQIS